MSPQQTRHKYYTWEEAWNRSAVFTSEYAWLNPYIVLEMPVFVCCFFFFFFFFNAGMEAESHRHTHAASTLNIHAHKHSHTRTSSSHLQPREVMKTNGRVLFPLGPEEELSHQANFILVWPRDSISSGCFYKRRAAPRHRPVMDMRAWWPDGRCWPCNSSSKHSLMTPLAPRAFLTQCNVAARVCICKLVLSKQTVLLFFRPKQLYKYTYCLMLHDFAFLYGR